MTSKNCELCGFKNPKGSVTAVILRDNKVLVLKRAEEPFKGKWDLPGGYMQQGEGSAETLKRELKEELGVDAETYFVEAIPGTAQWKDKSFSVINFFYLAFIRDQKIALNEENLEFDWVPLKDLKPEDIAFDSNQMIAKMAKEKFLFDLVRVKELVGQLDSTAVIKEESLYKAVLSGFVSKRFDGDKLVGMGWIFPRQTALRKQAIVEDMIVDNAYRGKGLGREILRDLLKWAKKSGCDMVELTTNPKREAANELYKSEGFWLHPTNHYLYTIVK